MPEEKPVQPKKVEPKKVLESDLIAFKKGALEREKKLKEELAGTRGKLAETESALKIAKLAGEDDEEVRKVKDYLLGEETRIREAQAKLDEDLTSFTGREREVRAKELSTEKGIDVESILGEETIEGMERKALELYAERLVAEKKALEEKQVSSESVFESTPGGVITKSVWGKSQEEFDEDYERQKKGALAKR